MNTVIAERSAAGLVASLTVTAAYAFALAAFFAQLIG